MGHGVSTTPSSGVNRPDKYRSEDLINKQNGDELIRRGNVNTALDMYARNGEWDRCLDLAEKSAPKALPHYLQQHCKFLARDKEFLGACKAFVRYGAPRDPQNYPLYKLICSELCAKKFGNPSEETTMWSCLREMLLRVVAGSQVPPPAYSKIDSEVHPGRTASSPGTTPQAVK